MCTYVRNPEYDEEYAKSLELDRIQYHQFQDIQRRNSDNSIAGRVAVTVNAENIYLLYHTYYTNARERESRNLIHIFLYSF